jgi:hypothetical protein
MTEGAIMTSSRFTVYDSLAATASCLITNGQRARRYWVLDTEAEGDRVYDEFVSKRAATETARDLNEAAYGPLADSSSV